MIRFLADENLNIAIVQAVRRRAPEVDLVRVQEIGLSQADDPAVLEWAAANGRIVLTHDARDLPGFAYARVAAGLEMPGVFEIRQYHPLGEIVADILLLAQASRDDEWANQVNYLPLR